MPNFTNDSIFDAGLDQLINNADLYVLLNGEPASYTEAITIHEGAATNRRLASAVIGAVDFTKADGDTSGRKATLASKNVNGEHTAGGEVSATYWAILDTVNTVILSYGPTLSSIPITNGVSQPMSAFDPLEIRDTIPA